MRKRGKAPNYFVIPTNGRNLLLASHDSDADFVGVEEASRPAARENTKRFSR